MFASKVGIVKTEGEETNRRKIFLVYIIGGGLIGAIPLGIGGYFMGYFGASSSVSTNWELVWATVIFLGLAGFLGGSILGFLFAKNRFRVTK